MAEKEKNVSYSMGHHGSRFSAVEHAENTSATLKRISGYFSSEKNLVFSLLLVVEPCAAFWRRACKARLSTSLPEAPTAFLQKQWA